MEKKIFIGIDVSKEKVDIAVLSASREIMLEKIINNDVSSCLSFFKALFKKLSLQAEHLLVCCENTGIYGRPLELSCQELAIDLWVENALKIKRASTDFRGKSDKKDALRIAEYANRYQDRVIRFQQKNQVCQQLQDLLHAREDLLTKKVSLQQQLTESKKFMPQQYDILKKAYSPVINAINKQLKEIKVKIDQIAVYDKQIDKNKKLLMSITGIGEQNALQFIIHTDNFTRFHNAKHLACYIGVVPFPNQSGTTIKKDRISKQAKKGLKKLIHMAAMSSIKSKGELQDYFIRKVSEGKNKMAVLNAIRNKLVHRMFAVIERGTPYSKAALLFSSNSENNSC